MIETPNRAAHIDIIEETIGPIGRLWSLSMWNKHNLVFIFIKTVLQCAIQMTTAVCHSQSLNNPILFYSIELINLLSWTLYKFQSVKIILVTYFQNN